MKVFVYGTLKQGYGNHNRLLRGSAFLGNAYVLGWTLYDTGAFPAAVRDPENKEPRSVVFGEVYEVDDATLDRLDTLEGEGYLYRRVEGTAYSPQDAELEFPVMLYEWMGEVGLMRHLGAMWHSSNKAEV